MNVRNTLANIRIVLINTSHPGNIGSAARAMKTMGLSELYLVSPKSFPDEQANTMSSNATDILEKAVVVESLQEAEQSDFESLQATILSLYAMLLYR